MIAVVLELDEAAVPDADEAEDTMLEELVVDALTLEEVELGVREGVEVLEVEVAEVELLEDEVLSGTQPSMENVPDAP
jgi:hypothetical protein